MARHFDDKDEVMDQEQEQEHLQCEPLKTR